MKTIYPLLVCAASLSMSLAAQDPPPENVYRIEYTLHESAPNQQVKDRHYSLVLDSSNWGRVTIGSKVPYLAEKDKYNYADVGVTINCQLREKNGAVSLNTKFEMSSKISGGDMPEIKSFRSECAGVVPMGKAARLISMDDPNSERHYDIDVVATKM